MSSDGQSPPALDAIIFHPGRVPSLPLDAIIFFATMRELPATVSR
jgi:hypothetical protein